MKNLQLTFDNSQADLVEREIENHEDLNVEETCCNLNSSVTRQRSNKKRNRRHKDIDRFTLADVTTCCTQSTNGVRGKGKRRQNRIENVKFLLSFWDKDEIEEEMIVDEPITTIFSRVVTDMDKMMIWNNFAALSGEEQDEYLAFIERSENRRRQWKKIGDSEKVDNPAFRTDMVDTTLSADDSPTNILSSELFADVCFSRIERHLRNALTKNHVPLGILEKLETELITFFEHWPTSKYTSVLSSSYERLLLHALCQYLGLLSQSVTLNGSRCTHVQNTDHAFFQPPPITLCRYLQEKLR